MRPVLRLIDRYILREVFSHTLLGLAVFTFVFFVPQLVRLMDLVVRHTTTWGDVGTLFVASTERLSAKKYWIAFTLRPRGEMVLDRGAVEAVRAKGKSVLSVGVLGIRGGFRAGDAVRIVDAEGTEIARGLARCGAAEAAIACGKTRDDLPEALMDLAVLVHADDLVVGVHG